MKILIAEKAGFCFGVRRAIRMVEKALDGDEPVWSLGPIIHNPQVIRQLQDQGLRLAQDLSEVEGGTVVIRSHGAPLRTYDSLGDRGLRIVDATCPFVKKMHSQARSLMNDGYQLIIVGDRNHSEITSLTDDPHFNGLVISRAAELDGVSIRAKTGLISQTTQPLENLCEVANRLLPEAAELRVYNTICDSTLTRQVEAREIAARVDVMVVIGGRNSANTKRLVEISQATGTTTLWVETAGEITVESLAGVQRVGITAGASTPEWIITEVVTRVDALAEEEKNSGTTLSEREAFQYNRR